MAARDHAHNQRAIDMQHHDLGDFVSGHTLFGGDFLRGVGKR